MKKLVAAAVVLVLLLVAAPWGFGKMAEARINRDTDALLTTVSPYIHLVDRKWTGGWFKSEQVATYEFKFAGLEAAFRAASAARARASGIAAAALPPAEPLRFQIHHEVLHGPMPGFRAVGLARVNSQPVFSDKVKLKIKEIFGTEEPVQLSTRVRFFDGNVITLSGKGRSIPLGKLAGNEAGTIAWDDFHLSVAISKGAKKFSIEGKQPRIEINESRSNSLFKLTGITVDGDSERITEDLFATDMKFSVGKLHVSEASTPPVEVDALAYGIDTNHKDGFLDYGLKLGSGEVRSDVLKKSGLQLRKINYDVTLRHLNIDTLQKMASELKAAYSTAGTDLDATLMPILKKHGMKLLEQDPEFVVDRMGIETPDGNALLKGSIRLVGFTEQDLSAGLAAVMQKLVGDFTIEIAQALIDKVPNGATMTGAAIDQGMVKREGGKLVSHIEFKDGKLTVNGKVQNIPLPGAAVAAPQPLETPPVRAPIKSKTL